MTAFKNFGLSLLTLIACSACGGSDDGAGPAGDGGATPSGTYRNWVNWAAVPAAFHPRIDNTALDLKGINKIKIYLSNFEKDISVIYSPEVQEIALLRLYKVHSWSENDWGRIQSFAEMGTLDAYHLENYSCKIHVINENITSLEGGCFVRAEVIVPENSTVEIYNLGTKISK